MLNTSKPKSRGKRIDRFDVIEIQPFKCSQANFADDVGTNGGGDRRNYYRLRWCIVVSVDLMLVCMYVL